VRKFVILPVIVIWLLGCAITSVPSGPAKEFQEAAVSVKEKRYNEAVAAYKKIAAVSPRSALAADALYEIALVHLFHDNPRKEYAQAIRTFEEFLKFHPDNKRAPDAQNWIYILKTIQELKKNNEQLNRTIQELKKNNEQLNMSIEELKRLDVMQEERRETR
jgi:outer membrane protein assembly factor BamD (BamD/ComL family)